MKKTVLFLLMALLMVGAAQAVNVTTDWTQVQWPATTTIVVGSSTTSAYSVMGGSDHFILTVGTDSANTTAEVNWYFTTGSTILSTESITQGVEKQVLSSRARFTIYNSGVAAITPEACIYCY